MEFLGQLEYTKVTAAWTSVAGPFFTLQEHIGQHTQDGEEAKHQEYLGGANEDSSWQAGSPAENAEPKETTRTTPVLSTSEKS